MSKRDQHLRSRRRRALYRAWHRGTKEMDLLLGRYADSTVGTMDETDLATFEQLLTLPDPDMHHWIVRAPQDGPDGVVGNFIARLRRFHGLEA